MQLNKIAEIYLNELEKNSTLGTKKIYSVYLTNFSNFIQNNYPLIVSLESLNIEHINNFIAYFKNLKTKNGRNFSISYLSYHLVAIRSLFRFANEKGFKCFNWFKISIPKPTGRRIKFLDSAQIKILLASTAAFHSSLL